MKLKNIFKTNFHPMLYTLFIIIALGIMTFFYGQVVEKIVSGIIIISFAYVFTIILGRSSLKILNDNKKFFKKRSTIKALVHSTYYIKLLFIAYIFKNFIYQECVANKFTNFSYFNITFNTDICNFYLNLGTMIIPFLLLIYYLTDLLIAKYIKKIINE